MTTEHFSLVFSYCYFKEKGRIITKLMKKQTHYRQLYGVVIRKEQVLLWFCCPFLQLYISFSMIHSLRMLFVQFILLLVKNILKTNYATHPFENSINFPVVYFICIEFLTLFYIADKYSFFFFLHAISHGLLYWAPDFQYKLPQKEGFRFNHAHVQGRWSLTRTHNQRRDTATPRYTCVQKWTHRLQKHQ